VNYSLLIMETAMAVKMAVEMAVKMAVALEGFLGFKTVCSKQQADRYHLLPPGSRTTTHCKPTQPAGCCLHFRTKWTSSFSLGEKDRFMLLRFSDRPSLDSSGDKNPKIKGNKFIVRFTVSHPF
jgi:hypothetical protein